MQKAYLIQQEFNDLLEYSMSIPTGVIIGKKWKRNRLVWKGGEDWLLCEYIPSTKLGHAKINYKKIVVVGTRAIDKKIAKFMERQNELDQ